MVLLESNQGLKTGQKAPDFDLPGIDGSNHTLSSYDSYEGVLVIFMCNHCPYVKAKIEAIKEIHQTYGKRVAIVGINSNDATKYPDDSFDSMKEVAAEKGMEFDYLYDESQQVAKSYGAICTPDPFLFDSKGSLVFHGRIDNAMKPEDAATEKTMMDNIGLLLDLIRSHDVDLTMYHADYLCTIW